MEVNPINKLNSANNNDKPERKKGLLVQIDFNYRLGGGITVAAWALQALADKYDISVLTLAPVNWEGVDRYHGSSLTKANFKEVIYLSWLVRLLAKTPFTLGLLRTMLAVRGVRKLAKYTDYAFVLSTSNELIYPGIQYIHYPWMNPDRPDIDIHWYHKLLGAGFLYRKLCYLIGGINIDVIRNNMSLCNSRYIGNITENIYINEWSLVYPPLPGKLKPRLWDEREHGFVSLGRLESDKKLVEAISIIKRVRELGHNVTLELIGVRSGDAYFSLLQEEQKRNSNWLTISVDLERATLLKRIGSKKYALHAMVGEHFGIAVAELCSSGCVTFVSEIGGPREIIGEDSRLMFSDYDDAVGKIDAVLNDEALQEELHRKMLSRSELFSSGRFIKEINNSVEKYLASQNCRD